ncbi:hypothetical protein [Amycolatopsis sp. CA-230715]|uniref:hypothetical protein n=1 Tax=Amycolatopsis sp. CA-230715 TaxID=2745196 RepID=UPI001C00A704|nr:hypothetical protein [Amycolatopsis sp. CA-230715]QWF79764.1 hypothetical protein HUW46_03176 [Amycolatopsis sp. CA-230715]
MVVTSPDGPTTTWPSRTLAGQTFAAITATRTTKEPTWPRPGLTIGNRQLPGILVPSKTDLFVAKARSKPPNDGEPSIFVVQHDFLAGEERDTPSYLGVGARATMFVNLSSRLCPSLKTLAVALEQDGARLYVHAHRADRYGFLRFDLSLSGLGGDLDTAISPVDGNIQEFLAVAYQTGVIELHLSRESSNTSLSCACSADAIEPVVDRALAELADAEHPATPTEHDSFVAKLRPALIAVNDSLDPSAAIPLTLTSSAPPFLALEVVI